MSWNEIGFTMTNDNINCYASFENIWYIYIQHYEDDKIYSFEDIEGNENTKLQFSKKQKNSLELSFNYSLSNSSDILYTFIITDSKNKNSFNSRIFTFENFYLKNSSENSEFQVYQFELKSAEKKGEIATKFIEAPSKFDIKDKSKNFTYVLMAEVLPTKMFHIYRSNDYNYHDEDKDKESDDNTALVIIIVVVVILVVIILIATIFVIRAFRKKDSENIDSQVKDKSLGEGITLSEV